MAFQNHLPDHSCCRNCVSLGRLTGTSPDFHSSENKHNLINIFLLMIVNNIEVDYTVQFLSANV